VVQSPVPLMVTTGLYEGSKTMRSISLLIVVTMALVAVGAQADVPIDPEFSYVSTTCPGGPFNPCVVYNRLDGTGRGFDDARLANGMIVDATIRLEAIDVYGNPIVGLPAEEMWLETTGGGLVYPAGGTIADQPTDQFGQTLWREPLQAGGCSLGWETVVRVQGWAIGAPLNVAYVSADINGDLVLNLADVQPFAAAYTGVYDSCADLDYNSHINLGDLALFARAYGTLP
jgi:hypothetical protein